MVLVSTFSNPRKQKSMPPTMLCQMSQCCANVVPVSKMTREYLIKQKILPEYVNI